METVVEFLAEQPLLLLFSVAAVGTWMSAVSNQYAAMPSLHCAWALWTAAAVSSVATHRLLRTAIWLLPVLTALVVIVTANHYILDIVAAGLVTALGIAGAALLQQSRAPRSVGGQGR